MISDRLWALLSSAGDGGFFGNRTTLDYDSDQLFVENVTDPIGDVAFVDDRCEWDDL